MKIAVTDGIDLGAKKDLQELGHSVSEKHYSNDDLIDGCISCLLYTSDAADE